MKVGPAIDIREGARRVPVIIPRCCSSHAAGSVCVCHGDVAVAAVTGPLHADGTGPQGFAATWRPGDVDMELSDPFKASTVRLQFAAFIPSVETTAPGASYSSPRSSTEGSPAHCACVCWCEPP